MSKNITIKLTKSSGKVGPFIIYDQLGNIIAENVDKATLIGGMSYTVADNVTSVKIVNDGTCNREKTHTIGEEITSSVLANTPYETVTSTCLFRHLTDVDLFNNFYGEIHPYILEHCFAYQYQDEILQNVKSYDKVFKYLPNGYGVFAPHEKIELDDVWFNKAILYNGQQSTGVLELVPKPKHNLKLYNTYPLYKEDSKVITFTKSDNFYQYNTFWSCVKDKTKALFITDCDSLSIDKQVNQGNMDYGKKSFNKAPLKAKDLKIRHILDDRSDVRLTSQFIISPSQLSYK